MTAREYDSNGWFSVKRNPLSKVGVFPYLGSSIGAPAERANEVFQVYRPAEELASPECLASFQSVPIIDDHEMLGSVDVGLTPVERKGVGGVTGDDIVFDNGTLYGNIKIFSEALARQINSGKKELSCGYRCEYDFSPGEFNGVKYDVVQRKMRGNHVAVVKQGRMGPDVAVLDHRFTYDHVDAQELQPVLDKDTQAAIDAAVAKGLEAVPAAVAQAVADAMPAALAKAKEDEEAKAGDGDEEKTDETLDAKAAADAKDRQAAIDAAVEKATKPLKDQLAAAKPTLDALDAANAATEKAALIERLKPHVGSFDAKDMTVDQVVTYGLDKLGVTGVQGGQERAVLDGWLRAKPVPAPVALDAALPADNPVLKHIAAASGDA